jgi:hypothetical protein
MMFRKIISFLFEIKAKSRREVEPFYSAILMDGELRRRKEKEEGRFLKMKRQRPNEPCAECSKTNLKVNVITSFFIIRPPLNIYIIDLMFVWECVSVCVNVYDM